MQRGVLLNHLPERKPLHLATFDYKGPAHVYFITICAYDKKPLFLNYEVARFIVDELKHRRAVGEIVVYSFCVMLDHLHLLLSLGLNYDRDLRHWVSVFKRYAAREAHERFGINPLWQRNFYEHVVRDNESLTQKAQYILNNPVRKMLATAWEEYPFCGTMDSLPM
jgi:REP element-mobilizing transposase RayT